MKIKSLSSATLVAALVIGVVSPVGVLAAPTELSSTGTVTVTEGTAGGVDVPTIDPENPDNNLPAPLPEVTNPDTGEKIPSPGETTNPDTGSLVIEKTTDLLFGTISTSANEVKKYAMPVSFPDPVDAAKITTRGSYIQWADVRDASKFGYTVTAELAQQFTGKTVTNKLTAATIDFSNGLLATASTNTNVKPGSTATAFQLTESGGAVTAVTADQAKSEGKGRYTMEFGQSAESAVGTKGTDDKSVQLTVPASTATNMALDTYTAKITWKIVAAPAPAPAP